MHTHFENALMCALSCAFANSLCFFFFLDSTELLNEKIMESLQKTLDMMMAQIVTAKKAVKSMKRQMEEDQMAEDDSDSDDADLKRKK